MRHQQQKINRYGIIAFITVITFLLLFAYLSLNLKTIDSGYEMQELVDKEQKLQEEIAKLKSDKAQLLNLERVERIVTKELQYQYPEPDQFIKVYGKDYQGK